MTAFVKRPVEVQALQWTGRNIDEMNAFLDHDLDEDEALEQGQPFNVETLEGPLQVEVYAWVIRGVTGELYPCREDIFALTYEPAVAAQQLREKCAAAGHPLQRCHCGAQGIGSPA